MSSRPPKDYRRPHSLGVSLPELPEQNSNSTTAARHPNGLGDNRKEGHYASIPDLFGKSAKKERSDDEYHKDSCCNHTLVLFLVLIVAGTALVLIILITLGKVGSRCVCSEGEMRWFLALSRWTIILSFEFESAPHGIYTSISLKLFKANSRLLTLFIECIKSTIHDQRIFSHSTNRQLLYNIQTFFKVLNSMLYDTDLSYLTTSSLGLFTYKLF